MVSYDVLDLRYGDAPVIVNASTSEISKIFGVENNFIHNNSYKRYRFRGRYLFTFSEIKDISSETHSEQELVQKFGLANVKMWRHLNAKYGEKQ